MKKLKILLTCLLLTISFCFTSFASYSEKHHTYYVDTGISRDDRASTYSFTPSYYRYCYVVNIAYWGDYNKRYSFSHTTGNISLSSSYLHVTDNGTGNRHMRYIFWLENAGASGAIVFKKLSNNGLRADPDTITIYVNKNAQECTHNWSGWQSDSTQHWRTCSWCGAVDSKGAHVQSGNSCSICGRVMHTHNSNKKVWVKQPTCTSAGSYYLVCSDDNTRMSNEVSVPATGHS